MPAALSEGDEGGKPRAILFGQMGDNASWILPYLLRST
jgi:hypothetical protein